MQSIVRVNQQVKQLASYLQTTGKKQYELASDLGVPPPTVNRWLTGKVKISKAYQTIMKTMGILK